MFKDNFIIHWFAFYLSIDDWVLNFNSCSYSKLNIKKIYFRIPDLKCQAQIQKGIGDLLNTFLCKFQFRLSCKILNSTPIASIDWNPQPRTISGSAYRCTVMPVNTFCVPMHDTFICMAE